MFWQYDTGPYQTFVDYDELGDSEEAQPFGAATSVGGVVQRGKRVHRLSEVLQARFGKDVEFRNVEFLDQTMMSDFTCFMVSDTKALAVLHSETSASLWDDRRVTFDYVADHVPRFENMLAVGNVEIRSVDGQNMALMSVQSEGMKGLPLAEGWDVSVGQKCYCIGHPMGLPKKKSALGTVSSRRGEWFQCRVDSMVGSSGSPILNEAGKVVGVLVQGRRDFVAAGVPTIVQPFSPDVGGESCVSIGRVREVFGF